MDTAIYDQERLVELAGPVGAREFNSSYESCKPKLWEWLNNLDALIDDELHRETQYRIYESASCGRFTGNFEDVHCYATACFTEANRRHRAVGHAEDCHGPTIYSRAHARVMRDHGYEPSLSGTCNCPNLKDA